MHRLWNYKCILMKCFSAEMPQCIEIKNLSKWWCSFCKYSKKRTISLVFLSFSLSPFLYFGKVYIMWCLDFSFNVNGNRTPITVHTKCCQSILKTNQTKPHIKHSILSYVSKETWTTQIKFLCSLFVLYNMQM